MSTFGASAVDSVQKLVPVELKRWETVAAPTGWMTASQGGGLYDVTSDPGAEGQRHRAPRLIADDPCSWATGACSTHRGGCVGGGCCCTGTGHAPEVVVSGAPRDGEAVVLRQRVRDEARCERAMSLRIRVLGREGEAAVHEVSGRQGEHDARLGARRHVCERVRRAEFNGRQLPRRHRVAGQGGRLSALRRRRTHARRRRLTRRRRWSRRRGTRAAGTGPRSSAFRKNQSRTP